MAGCALLGPQAYLCQNGGVLRLHHGVDDGLGVDHDVDVVVLSPKQVVCLDDLQACKRKGTQRACVYG